MNESEGAQTLHQNWRLCRAVRECARLLFLPYAVPVQSGALALWSLRGTTGFFQNCPAAAAAPLKSVNDATFHTDTRAARWHAAPSRNPDSSSPIVDLESAVAENSVA